MSDVAWIDAALTAARPQAVGALLRYFRDLDLAEEAFQDACLRALKAWPRNGPPRDAAAWLIMVGRNAAIDGVRRRGREQALPPEDLISDLSDAEAEAAERLDGADYRDDVLRLMFICCHPGLPATQQIALALRIVGGLSVMQIARAFLVGEAAMEQRITRAKARIAKAGVAFETPGPIERAERLAAVAAMIYLVFNEGYSAPADEGEARWPLCDEAIRLARLLLRLYPSEPEIMGLTALLLLQHARAAARFDADGAAILLEDQDRSLWNQDRIGEGLALIDKAMRHRASGPYQVQAAIAALHARAARAQDTDWAEIDTLYATLERLQPSPVVTLNRAVAVSKVKGPAEALAMIEPLASRLSGYFYFFGVRGALLAQLGRPKEARQA
ncbi:MAG TPA: RNA polymerase sigma factor, partial [Caulobacteraceae bacterium]|nr:RNA polymerase sigma factor [Caulobacteraceae bacterium]